MVFCTQLPVGLACHRWHQAVKKSCLFSFEEVLFSLWSAEMDIELAIVQLNLLQQLVDEDNLLTAQVLDNFVRIACCLFFLMLILNKCSLCAIEEPSCSS